MGVNKVDLANGETLIDLTKDTITPQTLEKGVTAHDARGEPIVGTMVAGEGGTGGGIIDVTELPTSNIVENAVYRVTVSTEPTVYVYAMGALSTLEDFLLSMGITLYIYFVDELPADIEPFDEATETFYCYVVNSTGIGYANFPGVGVATLGILLLGNSNGDKGYVVDITGVNTDGIYTVKGSENVSLFVYENGEWERLTPEEQAKSTVLTNPDMVMVLPDEGKVLNGVTIVVDFATVGELVDGNFSIDKITAGALRRRDGKNNFILREYAFAHTKARSIELPSNVTNVPSTAFLNSAVEEVTIRGRVGVMSYNLFTNCPNLKTLNVSWSVYSVSGAPWGATNATINYNYTGE